MITTLLIDFAYWVLNNIISWFPSGSALPADVHTAVTALGSYVSIFDPLIPFGVLASCVAFVIVVELAIFAFHAFNWIFGHVPFIGGKH